MKVPVPVPVPASPTVKETLPTTPGIQCRFINVSVIIQLSINIVLSYTLILCSSRSKEYEVCWREYSIYSRTRVESNFRYGSAQPNYRRLLIYARRRRRSSSGNAKRTAGSLPHSDHQEYVRKDNS